MISIFIPIRKGSKRIKNKNIKSLPGFKLGLTEIKVKQLIKLKNIYKKEFNKNLEIVFSTDSKIVKKFLKQFKSIKHFDRNKNLATDDSLGNLIKHVPKICSNEYILWSHVTSPLFNEYDYIDFIKKFFLKKKTIKSNSAFSAELLQKFILNNKFKWISHNYSKKKWPRTQDLKPLYIINSAAFIATRNTYIYENDRLCKKPIPIISRTQSGFDIDTIEDFKKLKKDLYFKKIQRKWR